jgi:3',5'-cyclic AMP phosphodiesterase CpdA
MLSKIVFTVLVCLALSQNIGYFWQISDPHIDVDYKEGSDPHWCAYEIMCCRHFHANQTSKAGKFGETGASQICDAPHSLIAGGFDFIKEHSAKLNPKPDFLFLTGDFAAHDNEYLYPSFTP